MKRFKISLIALVGILFGCQQPELVAPEENGAVKMKTVTVSAGIDGTDTKASLDSQTGAFTWQSGDLLSVLATDGNFYDFVLEGEAGSKHAEFIGQIPEGTNITTVATYPRIVANGAANTVLSNNTLNYVLPATWTYAKSVSNVPMVATFGEGAEEMSFKQVGGVMRFPVKNLPMEATFVVTMNDKTITGEFPVDIATLGESCMIAGTTASELVINYTSDADGQDAEFNVPVPTGVYNNFKVTIKDASDNVLLTKDYSKENTVKRATLLNMQELVLPERAMVISEVWPFFVDARVVFGKYDGITEYAFYIDGATEPVIVEAEDLGDKNAALIGGKFAHNSTHKVAVAKVVDGKPVVASKSAEVEFTTANVFQMTQNTGTKFVTAGWDDVAIGWGPKYDTVKKMWSVVSKTNNPNNVSVHYKRGYQVQLLAADKTTVIYDLIPFCGHEAFTGAYSDSSWLGKVNGDNILIPTALAFGYLEPGQDYYFRVRTLDEAVGLDSTNGNYNPEDNGSYPVPYSIYSERGGCAWSELVKFSTDAAHVASENEILYEGFDDIMVHSDYVNWAPAVVPDLEQIRIDWATYGEKNMATTYPEFLKKSASERKWTVQAFSKQLRSMHLGLHDVGHSNNTDIFFNANAGSLEGWAYNSDKNNRTVYPIFGAVRIGQSGSSGNKATLKTPAINSDKLLLNKGIKCRITTNIAYCATDGEDNNGRSSVALGLCVNVVRDGANAAVDQTMNVSEIYPEEYASFVTNYNQNGTNYSHHQRFYEVSCEVYLRKGDQLSFAKPSNNSNKGMLVIGDIKVEVIPGAYEQNDFVDNGIGTEPDDTNYDVYGLGELPISHWYTVEPWSYTNADGSYNDELTKARYQEMRESGINVALYMGHSINSSIAEQKRILGICEQVGLKFIGQTQYGGNVDMIPQIKEQLATSPAYIGDYIYDEPKANLYDSFGPYVNEFLRQMPDKDVYINLYPTYAASLGTASYESYIEEYLDKVPTKMLSYDYYGLMKNEAQIPSDYYLNLDLVRSKTLDRRMPFMVITQAGEVNSRKYPTEKEQRWTVWSTLAGGAKGISYFCYWTPSGGSFDDKPYMIDLEGNKTDMYDYIKRVNADINTIGKKLLPCHADGLILSVTTNYSLFDNGGRGRTNYGPIKGVSAVNNHVAVGCFRDARRSENGENYKGYKALVVARNPARNIDTRLTLDSSVTTITVTQNNTTEVVQLNNLLDITMGCDNGINLTYTDGKLTLNIPEGEALLIEF